MKAAELVLAGPAVSVASSFGAEASMAATLLATVVEVATGIAVLPQSK